MTTMIRLVTSMLVHGALCLGVVIATGCGQSDTVTPEANKAVVRHWAELEDQGQIEALADLVTPDCVFHYPGGVEVRGTDALLQNAARSVSAFSDQHRRIDFEVAEGDLVATRYTFTAKHTGEYLGVPPTGNDITFTFMTLCRMADGRMAECWVELDSQAMMRQLGAGVDPTGTG
jgi:steroid delta-isomerase-like uncharacterized protein